MAALAFLGTVLGGAISFAVNQLLIKGAADRAAKKREKEDEQRRERYILQMDSRKATFDLLSCICAGIERCYHLFWAINSFEEIRIIIGQMAAGRVFQKHIVHIH